MGAACDRVRRVGVAGHRHRVDLYGNPGSPLDFTSDPGAKPDGMGAVVLTPPTQLHSVGGLTGLLEQTHKRFGSTVGYRLVVYPTYAVFDRPDPSGDRRVLAYTYRGGWGDPTSSAKNSADGAVPVDLSKFNVAATVGILRCSRDLAHEAVRREKHISRHRAGK